MAEPGEITSNPSDPSAGPEPDLKSSQSAAGKRRREDERQVGASSPPSPDGEESAPKRRAKAQEVLFRIVVPSRKIGKVIGREGCRIRKVREDSKATVKIADAIARHEERVIIISSKENDNQVSDAENALQQIATLILKEDDSSTEASKVGAGHVAANTIRLLIAGSQAGSLIGVSGQNIEKLRNSSGAMITILAPNQLPLCASAHESDRVVQISGDASAVLKALEDIGVQLRENPPKKVISVSPANNYPKVQLPQSHNGQFSADYVTFEMVISETMVGGLIGKNGSNISRIRNESGATIKVHGAEGEKNQRRIWFAGSSQQVESAKRSVQEYICSQLLQQSGAQQRAVSTTLLRQSSRSA